MAKRDIVVIGASAGGLEALKVLLGDLPANLPASIFVVLHLMPGRPSALSEILARSCRLPVAQAVDGERIAPGRVYIAPPNRHLILTAGIMRLTNGPKENRVRPAADALFRSAAQAYGARVVGVVLTGNLDDGTAGLWSVKDRQGITVVQDPADASAASMPRSAIEHVQVDHIAPIAAMGALLTKLVGTDVPEAVTVPVSKTMETETKIAMEGNALALGVMSLGPLTPYTCPECNGVLVELSEGGLLRFRCHTGHAYGVDSLIEDVTETIEGSLYGAMRGIEESSLIMRQLAQQLRNAHQEAAAQVYEDKADVAAKRADIIHQAIRLDEKSAGVGAPEPSAGEGAAEQSLRP